MGRCTFATEASQVTPCLRRLGLEGRRRLLRNGCQDQSRGALRIGKMRCPLHMDAVIFLWPSARQSAHLRYGWHPADQETDKGRLNFSSCSIDSSEDAQILSLYHLHNVSNPSPFPAMMETIQENNEGEASSHTPQAIVGDLARIFL